MQTETSEQVTESGDKTCEEKVEANDELICELEVQVIKTFWPMFVTWMLESVCIQPQFF